MNRSKVAAFFQEFPFLGRLLDENGVKSVYVRRVDRDLMAKTSQCWVASVLSVRWDVYLLLDKEGGVLTTARMRWRNPFGVRETVGDAIARLGNQAGRVSFVLSLFPAGNNKEIVLYKPPKGFTIQGWLEEEIRREQAVIRAESEAIDTLAAQK